MAARLVAALALALLPVEAVRPASGLARRQLLHAAAAVPLAAACPSAVRAGLVGFTVPEPRAPSSSSSSAAAAAARPQVTPREETTAGAPKGCGPVVCELSEEDKAEREALIRQIVSFQMEDKEKALGRPLKRDEVEKIKKNANLLM